MLIRDVLKVNKESINPQKHNDVLFCHYSLPAFDNNKTPEIQLGEEILSSKFKLTKPCILFNKLNVRFKRIWNLASVNKNYICSSEYLPLSVFNQDYIQDYMYYLLLSDMVNSKLLPDTNGTSSSHQRIDPNTLLNIEIKPISIDKQQHIVNILGTIDDKIENCSISNLKIEELIMMIYKKFITSLKVVKRVKIGGICKCVLGGTPSREHLAYWNGDINWINSGELNNFRITKPSEKITKLGLLKSNTCLIPKNNVMIAITGATLGQVSLSCIDTCTNQSVVSIIENEKLKSEFIYPLIKEKIKDLKNLQTGGAQQHINKGNVENFEFDLPNDDELKNYYSSVSSLYAKITKNCLLIEKLNELKQLYLKKFFG